MAKRPALTLVGGGFAPSVDPAALAAEDLARSGITLAQAVYAGISFKAGSEVTALDLQYELPCLHLPYHDYNGAALSTHPKWPQFYRVRWLLPTPPKENGKPGPRYGQPSGSGICAYIPKVKGLDWLQLAQDASQPLLIVEGEKKALKGCLEGFPTIGLGGVHNFRSAGEGIGFLPELERINWIRRDVVIAFDSDAQENPNICLAIARLAEELYQRGAKVRELIFTTEGDEKVGLDDFLVHQPDALEQLRHLIAEAVPLTMTKKLWSLNERYAYVQALDQICEVGSQQLRDAKTFERSNLERTYEYKKKKDGSRSLEAVAAVSAWLQWPLRAAVNRVVYDPAQPPLAVTAEQDFNSWPGFACQPKAGPVVLFTKLLDHLFAGADVGAKEWLLSWLAYPVQHPGTKLYSAVMIHGLAQGTGKSLIFLTLAKLYGENFIEVDHDAFNESFNSWAANRQFVLGDDVVGLTTADKRESLGLMKKLITQSEVTINQKYLKQYTIKDTINYAFTSNQADALFLEDKDRRFFIHEVTADPLPEKFYQQYDAWLKGPDCGPAMLAYLQTLPLAGFNPTAKAFMTTAKARMSRTSQGDLSTWVHDLLEYPDDLLVLDQTKLRQDLFTLRELVACYRHRENLAEGLVKSTAMARALSDAGFRQVHGGKPIRLAKQPLDRYYAIRNRAHWDRAPLEEIQRSFEPQLGKKVSAALAEVKKTRPKKF